MSSLPQGWHGIPVPSRNGISSSVMPSATTVPTTIRKKWNSPLSSEVPRSKLPAYKPLASRAHKNPTGSTLLARSTTKSSRTGSQSELSSSVKASPTKELQNEIAKLKKELATVKTENSILKVKVRRVDDENTQKSRQIEKLRVELKAVQKVESTGSKKSKDSELLLLRQKCLRLEGALKEKDLALNTFRKLNNESMKVEGAKAKRNPEHLEAGDADEVKSDKLNETQTLSKSSFGALSSLSRSSQSTKSEVAKLRDMIHKLENENQELQQQVKDKGEEIRRLKVHLRSQTYTKSSQTSSKTSVPNIASKTSVPNISSRTPISKSTFKMNSTTIKIPAPTMENKKQEKKLKESSVSVKSNGAANKQVKAPVTQVIKAPRIIPRPSTKKNLDSSFRSNSAQLKNSKGSSSNGVSKPQLSRKQTNGVQSKLPTTKSGKTFVVSKCDPPKSKVIKPSEDELDDQAQRLRENIAAKKIQRGWRSHQKRHLNNEDQQSLQKAMTFIVTSIKHHRSRKEKLNMLHTRKHPSPRLKVENESVIVEAIQAATKNLWAKELSVSN